MGRPVPLHTQNRRITSQEKPHKTATTTATMLPISTISSFLKEGKYPPPLFYYSTKTMYQGNVQMLYLFFMPDCAMLVKQAYRHRLEVLERVEYAQLMFIREDEMYLRMKWQNEILIGFRTETSMRRFVEKIRQIGIPVERKKRRRVVGNDEGESVSYKLNNESIEHISTDTAYEVYSVEMDEKNGGQTVDKYRINDHTDHTDHSSRHGRHDHGDRHSRNDHSSRHGRHSRNSRTDRNDHTDDRQDRSRHANDNDNTCTDINTDRNDRQTISKLNIIKSQIEFGDLNFFVLTEPVYAHFCRRVMSRLCEHFDKRRKRRNNCGLDLTEHFMLFIRREGRLYRLDTEDDFTAAVLCLNRELDVVIRSKE